MKNITKSAMIAALATPLILVAGASTASAAAPDDGCARGFELWDVETNNGAEEFDYQADNWTDEAGNTDGFVCARALGQGVSKSIGVDFTIYQFTDNDLPASSKG